MTVALRLADKFHGAILIVQSFPWSPDVLSIVNVIAQEDDEPSSGMGGYLHSRLCSSMTSAGHSCWLVLPAMSFRDAQFVLMLQVALMVNLLNCSASCH